MARARGIVSQATGSTSTTGQEIVASEDLYGPKRNDVVEHVFAEPINDMFRFALLAVDAIESDQVKTDSGEMFAHRTINLSGVLFDKDGNRVKKFDRFLMQKAAFDLFEAEGKCDSDEEMQRALIKPWAKNADGSYKSQIRIYFGSNSMLARVEPYGTITDYDKRLEARFAAYARGEEFRLGPKKVVTDI